MGHKNVYSLVVNVSPHYIGLWILDWGWYVNYIGILEGS